MEWLRSCYHSTWVLNSNTGQPTAGYYYFLPSGSPHLPFPHNLGSRNWTSDERGLGPALGETNVPIRSYTRGALPIALPPAINVGSPGCFASGEQFPSMVPGRKLPFGVDSRCYSNAGLPVPGGLVSGTFTMGVLLASLVFIASPYRAIGRAGLLLGGTAVIPPGFPVVGSAGLLLSGPTRLAPAPSAISKPGIKFSAVSKIGVGISSTTKSSLLYSAIATHTP